MSALLILKHVYDLSDEELVLRWLENPYWQFFSGENEFQWNFPCDPSELTVFRKRLGLEGIEKIFEVSAKIHGKKAMERDIIADTTAQE
jgi:transposase, IS5 family